MRPATEATKAKKRSGQAANEPSAASYQPSANTRAEDLAGRRRFLCRAGSAFAAALTAAGLEPLLNPNAGAAAQGRLSRPRQLPTPLPEEAAAAALPGSARGPRSAAARRNQAFEIRVRAARLQHALPLTPHPTNGDEDLYPTRIANFSKGLPHNSLGEVDPNAYRSLLTALDSGESADFENIPMGCHPAQRMRLVNPQAGLAFVLEGTDSHQLAQPPAPAFRSAEEAGELVENYWMALLRDVNFTDYAAHSLAHAAAADLSALPVFHGPKAGGQVTPATLFRGLTPGDLAGPYVSQFLLQRVPFGANEIVQKMETSLPDSDFMTTAADWLDRQNGCVPTATLPMDPVARYIRNGRDLGQWVHIDVLFQAYFHAALILLASGAPLNPGNPYHGSQTQDGFGTFGPPHVAAAVAQVATTALKTVWYQKWFVHRRLRPEEFAGRVHFRNAGAANYPIHEAVLRSAALGTVIGARGTAFLPMAFPEGCPMHPAYGAGHATVAGACVTVLKALFDESHVLPNPVVPDAPGTALIPYTSPDAGALTVGGELNKLASNVAIGRNHAGVHWRSDATESLKLGEAVALSILRDHAPTYNEAFRGFTLTKFDGTTVTV